MPKKLNYIFLLKVLLIELITTTLTMLLFATVLYFLEGGFQFSPLFASISLGLGCFLASLYASKKIGQKGLLVGSIVGGISFIIITLISLMASKDVFTLNTLFKLIILMLMSFIGGVLGVNLKQNQKYI